MDTLDVTYDFTYENIEDSTELGLLVYKSDQLVDSVFNTIDFDSEYSFVFSTSFDLDSKEGDLYRVYPYIKNSSDKIFILKPDYYLFKDNVFVPQFVRYSLDFNSEVFKVKKASFNYPINFTTPKKVVPNPRPFSFDRYDLASTFIDDPSLINENESQELEEVELINVSNLKERINISDLEKLQTDIRIDTLERVGYSSIQINSFFKVSNYFTTFSDSYRVSIFINNVLIKSYDFSINPLFKSFYINNLNVGQNKVSLKLYYNSRLLKSSNTENIFINYDKERTKKILSYDFK